MTIRERWQKTYRVKSISFAFTTLIALALSLGATHRALATQWTTNGPMTSPRQNQTATLLSDGKVLFAGGWNGSSALASAELFDPATGKCTVTGTMTTNRNYHTATSLPNGKVLVTGGSNGSGYHLVQAELFDPATGTWTNTGAMNTARYLHTATLLPCGQVLVAGGYNGDVLSSAEVYDPASGTWTVINSMKQEGGVIAGVSIGITGSRGCRSDQLFGPINQFPKTAVPFRKACIQSHRCLGE